MTTQETESSSTVAVAGSAQALTRCSYGTHDSLPDAPDTSSPAVLAEPGELSGPDEPQEGGPALPAQSDPPAQSACTCPLNGNWQAIPAARHFVTSTLRHWGLDILGEQVELVVSELVTNALRHGLRLENPGAPAATKRPPRDMPNTDTVGSTDAEHRIDLKLMHHGPRVVCVVTDPSDDIPVCAPVEPPEDPAGPDAFDDLGALNDLDELDYVFGLAEAGHGLHLVAAYSHRWGHSPLTHGGKAVWAMFDPPAAGDAT